MTEIWKTFMEAPSYYNHSPWFPNPVLCVRDMTKISIIEVTNRLPWNGLGVWLQETREMIEWTVYIDKYCLPLIMLIAVLFTCVRIILDSVLFKRIPVWFNLSKNGQNKFSESAWKSLVYSILWIWTLTIVLSKDGTYFFYLESHWNSWYPGLPLETSVYCVYMLEMGFYLHSIYATIFIETIRKDFAVMLTHHFLALGLLLFSYLIRTHVIGLMLLCFLDIGDVILELGKCILYFKDRNGRQYYWPEIIANIMFAIFTIQFFFCRIYWMLTKVLYSVTYIGPTWYGPKAPWFLLFVPLLWLLYAMQVYWFRLILLTLYKILIKGEVITDDRDYQETNGHTKHKDE